MSTQTEWCTRVYVSMVQQIVKGDEATNRLNSNTADIDTLIYMYM